MFTTLIQKVIIGIMGIALLSLGFYSAKQYFVNISNEITINKQKTDIINLNTAVIEYENILKIIPYQVLNKERGEKAHEDINTTYNDNTLLIGNDWMYSKSK